MLHYSLALKNNFIKFGIEKPTYFGIVSVLVPRKTGTVSGYNSEISEASIISGMTTLIYFLQSYVQCFM